MPSWLLNLLTGVLSQFGLPALKQLIVLLLEQLEMKFPGIKPLVDAVIAYLEGGASARDLHEHLAATVKGFPPAPKGA